MAKKILQDIIISKRPVSAAVSAPPILERIAPHKKGEERALGERTVEHPKKGGKGKRAVIFLGVILAIFGFSAYIFSSYFSSAIVRITPLKESIIIDDIILAVLGKNNKDQNSMHFETVKVEDKDFVLIPATGSEKVSRKAAGEIVVFNGYSAEPQKLIAGTRFESPTGKIYKIDKPIVVPGKVVSGGKSIPGSITVMVYASEPGEEYNSGPTDFTVPGLKGGPRYSYVYGRGKGDITGGFAGEIKTAAPSDIQSAKTKLEFSLKQKLLDKAKRQIPDNFILYDDAVFINIKDIGLGAGRVTQDGKLRYEQSGVLKGAIFDRAELAGFLAGKKLPGLKNYDAHANGLDDLDFKIIGKSNVNIDEDKAISFKLSGSADIVWNFDGESLKEKLVGLSKYKYEELFKDRPMVEKVEAVLSPVWLTSFPESADKIKVEVLE